MLKGSNAETTQKTIDKYDPKIVMDFSPLRGKVFEKQSDRQGDPPVFTPENVPGMIKAALSLVDKYSHANTPLPLREQAIAYVNDLITGTLKPHRQILEQTNIWEIRRQFRVYSDEHRGDSLVRSLKDTFEQTFPLPEMEEM